MFHDYSPTLSASFYSTFPDEKVNTHTHKKKNHCNSLPFWHENRWWRWQAVHGFTALAFSHIWPDPRLCMNRSHLPGLSLLWCWWSQHRERSFPATWTLRLNICIKQIAFVLQLLVNLLPSFISSTCWVRCVSEKQGMKLELLIIDTMYCYYSFLFIICIAVELRTPSHDRTLLN